MSANDTQDGEETPEVFVDCPTTPSSLDALQLKSFATSSESNRNSSLVVEEYEHQRCYIMIELFVVLGYIAGGLLFFCLYEHWTFVDSFYFVVVTVGTVGYGDMLPSDDASKLFTVAFVVCGVLLLTASIGHHVVMASESVIKPKEQTLSKDSQLSEDQQRIAWALLRIFVIVLIGMLFFACYSPEEISWVDALYLAVMTVTTVGYGDVAPTTEGGRIFACCWVLLGVTVFAHCVSVITSAYIRKKRRWYQKRRLARSITEEDVMLFGGADGKLDRCEFALMKLIVQEKICSKDIMQIWKEFEKMDVDQNGFLDRHDIILMNKRNSAELDAPSPSNGPQGSPQISGLQAAKSTPVGVPSHGMRHFTAEQPKADEPDEEVYVDGQV